MSSTHPVVLSDFVNSVPSPLTFALVSLSDSIALLRSVLQVLSWKSTSWLDGFLAVAAWWAFCRFATSIIRLFLPIVVLGTVVYTRTRRVPPSRQPVVTETLLQNTISDLTILPVLLPSVPSGVVASFSSMSLYTLARAAIILYIPYLALTCFVPLHLIFAVIGTVFLTWRSPFAAVLRKTVWRSAFIRWSVYAAWAHISGQPLPPKAISPQTKQLVSATEKGSTSLEKEELPTSTTSSLRFLFTVYENQRWWMGLDWTAALLPGERPSWCSASQAPLSPPGAFTLPETTTTYIPHPSDSTKKIKRTAEWFWEEPEWRVLVKKEGTNLSRVERPVPSDSLDNEDGTAGSSGNTSSRLFKAASSKLAGSGNPTLHGKDSSSNHHQETNSQEVVEGADEDTDGYTDPDGWIYGDNKWESKSNRGGMSKYTRYRRWTRVAVLTEFTQVVDATLDNTPDRRSKAAKPPPVALDDVPTGEKPASAPSTEHRTLTTPAAQAIIENPLSPGSAPESPLRQRLRLALNKSSIGHP